MKLYKHNEISEEYELSPAELAKKFMASEQFKDWREYGSWPLMRHIGTFIVCDLQSSFDEDGETTEQLEEVRQLVLAEIKEQKEAAAEADALNSAQVEIIEASNER